MPHPDVTIALVPRERFSHTARSLESIYAHTSLPFRLVCVDGGSPRRVARRLREQASARGFKLVRSERHLSPNEARNMALAHAGTKYVVFVDNDVLVSPGWLDALVGCAEETGAWAVGPLTMAGAPGRALIHNAGGGSRVEEVGGRRLFTEEHYLADRRLEEVEPPPRRACEMVEFHCMLVRAECFGRLGRLDERLLSMHEENDLCMAMRAAGGEVYFEPRAVVQYVPPSPVAASDLPYYLLRWSEDWNDASLARFREKWRLAPDDPGSAAARTWATAHRQSLLWPLRPHVDRFTGGRSYWIERRLLAPIERRLSDHFARRDARARARLGREAGGLEDLKSEI